LHPRSSPAFVSVPFDDFHTSWMAFKTGDLVGTLFIGTWLIFCALLNIVKKKKSDLGIISKYPKEE
jgi:hypothetical protein